MKKEVVLYFLFTVILVLVNIPLLNALLLPKIISILIIIFFALPFCYYTYKQGNPLKILSKAFCFFLFFNALFVVGWFETPWPTPFLQHKELCLEYVAENKLYGGQPYCLEGPFSYLVAKGVDVLPGSFETGLQAVSMLLLFSIFFFSLKTESKLMKKKYLFMSTVFFVFYFMKVGQDDFTSIVATFFMVSGFYILFVAEWKYKEMVGSILLAISIFSKAQFLGPAVIIIFFYSLKYLDEKKELYLNIFYTLKDSIEKCKAFLHSIFVLLLPFIILFILLNVIYPNFIVYYYLAHINQATLLTMSQVFSSLPILTSFLRLFR